MSLAKIADVEARLGRPLTDAERGGGGQRVDALLADASAAVAGYCGQDFEDPVPAAVVGVVAKMVARSLVRGESTGFVEQQNAGPFGVRYSAAASSGDVWFTDADKKALRPYRRGGGLTSVMLVGERVTIVEGDQ